MREESHWRPYYHMGEVVHTCAKHRVTRSTANLAMPELRIQLYGNARTCLSAAHAVQGARLNGEFFHPTRK